MERVDVNPKPAEPLLLTEKEAAQRLRMHPKTLQRLRKLGRAPVTPRQIGGRFFYKPQDIERLAKN